MHTSLRYCLVLIALLFATSAKASDNEQAKHIAKIEAVIEDFRTAIIAKDKARFLSLFHGMNIPWLAVLEDQSLAKMRERRPNRPKADPMGTPGPDQFIDAIAKDTERDEEKFSNVRIQTNGHIASVYFDYSFHRGDYMTNFGAEAWQLVNTDQGWKINSVIYSVELNSQPPKMPTK